MKCTNKRKKILTVLGLYLALLLSSCSSVSFDYALFDTSASFGLTASREESSNLLTDQLAIPRSDDVNTATNPRASQVGAALVVNDRYGHTLYNRRANVKVYPASTTKVLTFLTAMRHTKLDQEISVSSNARDIPSGSTSAGLWVGDQIRLEDALYAMLLPSGNDAAIAIAEGVSGSVNSFVDQMNATAASIGASHTHMVNPHGLHDENHYTTTNDMYLIFHEALKYPLFRQIVSSKTYTGSFRSANGSLRRLTWTNTNYFLRGIADLPENIQVIGGKTGTTDEAGSCLVLLSKNAKEEDIISIIFKAANHRALYLEMKNLLDRFGQNQ